MQDREPGVDVPEAQAAREVVKHLFVAVGEAKPQDDVVQELLQVGIIHLLVKSRVL